MSSGFFWFLEQDLHGDSDEGFARRRVDVGELLSRAVRCHHGVVTAEDLPELPMVAENVNGPRQRASIIVALAHLEAMLPLLAAVLATIDDFERPSVALGDALTREIAVILAATSHAVISRKRLAEVVAALVFQYTFAPGVYEFVWIGHQHDEQ